jgi:hypothetical protein
MNAQNYRHPSPKLLTVSIYTRYFNLSHLLANLFMHVSIYLVSNVYVYYPTYLIDCVDPLNHEFKLHDLQKFSAHLTEKRLSLNYKYNPVNVV